MAKKTKPVGGVTAQPAGFAGRKAPSVGKKGSNVNRKRTASNTGVPPMGKQKGVAGKVGRGAPPTKAGKVRTPSKGSKARVGKSGSNRRTAGGKGTY